MATASHTFSKFSSFFALLWLQVLRLIRGWRWRIFTILALAFVYWYGKSPGFGVGSLVWFAGAAQGINMALLFLTLAGLVFGIDSVGQWDRHRAMGLLQPRLSSPLTFAISQVFATGITAAPSILLITYTSVIGAWYYDYLVLWTPNHYLLAFVFFPALLSGAAAGLAARTYLTNDLGALFLGALFTTPLLGYRLFVAPGSEFFLLANGSLGILLPRETLLADALISYATIPLMLSLFSLQFPRPVVTSGRSNGWIWKIIGLPTINYIIRYFLVPIRQRSFLGLVIAGILLFVGVRGLLPVLTYSPTTAIWEQNQPSYPPFEAHLSPIPAIDILHRSIDMRNGADGPLTITLTVDARSTTHSLAVLDFGNAFDLKPTEAMTTTTQLKILNSVFPLNTGKVMVELDRSPAADRAQSATFQLNPKADRQRDWLQAWHPRYHYFIQFTDWYGQSVNYDTVNQSESTRYQATPFSILLPEQPGLTWNSGSADIYQEQGFLRLEHRASGYPYRLVAGPLIQVPCLDEEILDLRFLVQPHREELVQNFAIIFRDPLTRLARLTGKPSEPIIIYEVPQLSPQDPMALATTRLDAMSALLPNFDSFDNPSWPEFENLFPAIHRGLVEEIMMLNFSSIEGGDVLGKGLSEYLHTIGLGEGRYRNLARATGKDLILVPWDRIQNGSTRFGDLSEKAWSGPIFPSLRDRRLPAPAAGRKIAFFHMLRGLLGEEAFVDALQQLFRTYQNQPLTLDAMQSVFENAYGEPLDWYFEEWLFQGVMPKYRVIEGEAILLTNPVTRALEYRSIIKVTNVGTGSIPVPWILSTEGASREGKLIVGPGEEKTLEIKTIDRPVAFGLDPEDWVINQAPGKGYQDRIIFKTIREY